MLFEMDSAKAMDQIDADLRAAAARNRLGVLAVHDLRQTMNNKGVEFNMPCRVYEVCNPHQAKKVLEADGAISTALPCRISVYQPAGGAGHRIATLLPTALLALFARPELSAVAAEVEKQITAAIREAAGENRTA